MTPAPSLAGYKAVAKLYNALMTGLVLTLVTRKSAEAAAQFVFGHFRRQHLEKFLPGLKKLGLDDLPDAVACAQYHYFSNALGGVKTEYMPESDAKAWVRYPPPRWIWQGAAICAIPARVNEAMLHGWHGHNGVSLGNPRLGFVCTGQTVEGAPGLEGYYYDYGREIAESERVRFAPDESAPDFDPARAPQLDSASWPEERLKKVERAYAMEYVRSLLPTLLELFGPAETRTHLGHAARLVGMQFYDETAALLGIAPGAPGDFARYLAAMAAAQGETVEIAETGGRTLLHQQGWRLMDGLAPGDAGFAAWNELWTGALAVHNRRLRLSARREGDGIVWEIAG
ncbi:hypothetical protein [uncultured Parvibaculum sp.]|uniref:hypothetical protein n=1 Tax=uncultured Parvibaculum sp. TaxID=291828 RepID=UPI0030DD4D22|tara:strand:+ start:65156 stop:66181 length:1026 start_codon:yes stop_codon:yes gene_type:complete